MEEGRAISTATNRYFLRLNIICTHGPTQPSSSIAKSPS